MRRVDIGTYFTPDDTRQQAITDETLRDLYAYPPTNGRPYVRANFVSSIDGAVTVDDRSGGLGTPADHQVFSVLRELADAVVVGAGTARAEDYGGVHLDEAARLRRRERGADAVPPIVVISGSGNLDPEARLFSEASVPTVVLTGSDADDDALRRLEAVGADVVRTDDTRVSSTSLLDFLTERGWLRVICEGGPGLFGDLNADGKVDELCSTVSPVLVGGRAGRIARSATAHAIPMTPRHILADDDGTLLFRWVRHTSTDR
ncbi:pyrimidine reductase family protein [Rhodococcus sp. NPDC058521]|uniref:pyrimidine reductase family protein n=1 Tax=Rhodococcus sp. NPDC058521 TaxID=3346536 RepID=UPI0036636AA9